MLTLSEGFEAKIFSLKDTQDLSQLTLIKLENALEAVEQKEAFRDEHKPSKWAL